MAKDYTVNATSEAKSLQPGRGFVDVVTINFTTADGMNHEIQVPKSNYTADRVKDAIESYVAELKKTMAL